MVFRTEVLFWVMFSVPLLVAVKAGFAAVCRFSPPVKLIVVPELLLRKIPVPVSEIPPPSVMFPPVLF
jgi:hypothetical protein